MAEDPAGAHDKFDKKAAKRKDKRELDDFRTSIGDQPDWAIPPTPAQRKVNNGYGVFRVYENEIRIGDKRHYAAGLYLHRMRKNDKGEDVEQDHRLSAPLRVVAESLEFDEVFGPNGTHVGAARLVKWHSGDGWKEDIIKMAVISGDALPRWLMERNISIDFSTTIGTAGATNFIRQYLTNHATARRQYYSPRTGWHFMPDGQAFFLLPQETISSGTDIVKFAVPGSQRLPKQASGGTFEGWKKNVAAKAVGNYVAMASINMMFASPLLKLLGLDGKFIHWYFRSSSGKTVSCEMADTVWGHGTESKVSWNQTGNAIENVMKEHSDIGVHMNELGELDKPEDLKKSLYATSTGEGKGRMKDDTAARKTLEWDVCGVSTGEDSIPEYMRKNGLQVYVGQELRFLSVSAGRGTHRAFDNLHGAADGDAFAKEMEIAVTVDYGWAGPAFVRILITVPVETLREMFSTVRARLIVEGLAVSGQERRAADAFAIGAMSGMLAARWGIVPYSEEEALEGSMRAFKYWMEEQPEYSDVVDKEVADIGRAVFNQITSFSASRFDQGEKPLPDEEEGNRNLESLNSEAAKDSDDTPPTHVSTEKTVKRPYIIERYGWFKVQPYKNADGTFDTAKETTVYYVNDLDLVGKPYKTKAIRDALVELGALYAVDKPHIDKKNGKAKKMYQKTESVYKGEIGRSVQLKLYAIDYLKLIPDTPAMDDF